MKTSRYVAFALAAVLSMVLLAADSRSSGNVQVQFTTRTTGQKRSPKHVIAVWVADAQGGFVRTLMLRAKRQRGWLSVWQKSSAGSVAGLTDATSGATARKHEPIRLDWDCRDAAGRLVPDGSYQVMIEFTERNGPGPVTPRGYLPIEKGTLPFSVKPRNLDYFGDLRVTFTPAPAAASATVPLPYPPAAPVR